jgi:hypothetical protein
VARGASASRVGSAFGHGARALRSSTCMRMAPTGRRSIACEGMGARRLIVGDPMTLEGGRPADPPVRARFRVAAAARYALPSYWWTSARSSIEAAQRFAADRAEGRREASRRRGAGCGRRRRSSSSAGWRHPGRDRSGRDTYRMSARQGGRARDGYRHLLTLDGLPRDVLCDCSIAQTRTPGAGACRRSRETWAQGGVLRCSSSRRRARASSFPAGGDAPGADVLNSTHRPRSTSKGRDRDRYVAQHRAMGVRGFVVRHRSMAPVAALAAEVGGARGRPSINAGDGRIAHPTQGAARHAHACRQPRAPISPQLKSCGATCRHSRVARTDLHALARRSARAKVRVCGPARPCLPDDATLLCRAARGHARPGRRARRRRTR